MTIERELGIIRKVFFGIEDHGILTCYVHMDFGSTGQGLGGYSFDHRTREGDRVFHPEGLHFMRRLLETVGVRELDDVAGHQVFVLREGGRVIGIESPAFATGETFLFADAFQPTDKEA